VARQQTIVIPRVEHANLNAFGLHLPSELIDEHNTAAVQAHGSERRYVLFLYRDRRLVQMGDQITETIESAPVIDVIVRILFVLKAKIVDSQLPTLGKKVKNANLLLNLLFSRPVITVQTIEKELGLSKPAANNLVKDFLKLKILTETTGQKRNRQFAFIYYLKLLTKE